MARSQFEEDILRGVLSFFLHADKIGYHCAMLAALILAAALPAAASSDYWPSPFPEVGRESVREALTKQARRRKLKVGDEAVLLLPDAREKAGVLTFRIKKGRFKGLHQCEALGRGKTSFEPRDGWMKGAIGSTVIYYAGMTEEGGMTIPGRYELRNIRPDTYELQLLNKDLSGEDALVSRLSGKPGKRPFFSSVWKTWYPRAYPDAAPIDMLWVEGDAPVYERADVTKDPKQLEYNPKYYWGPHGRNGFAVHTDRWDDGETRSGDLGSRPEASSFLYRDTQGCVKVRADCLRILNAWVDERAKAGGPAHLLIKSAGP